MGFIDFAAWMFTCSLCCCFSASQALSRDPVPQHPQSMLAKPAQPAQPALFSGRRQASGPLQAPRPLCRNREQLWEPPFFELHACAWCFHYLMRSPHVRALPRKPVLLVISNMTSLPAGTVLWPNITSPTDVSKICSLMPGGKCERWKECCREARECCQRQVQHGPPANGSCPRTWDGWACWGDVPPGGQDYVPCPGFLQYAVLSSYGKKTCQSNGTWYKRYTSRGNGSEGRWTEWTDYTKCIDKQRLMTSVYLALGCNVCSILFLIPAILIFLVYRSLRRQHRIRLHVNLFAALLLANVMSLLWDLVVTHDRLTSDTATTVPVLLANGAGCKLLAFLRLYLKSTTYVWMFCEGFYLHRLISNAFRPPKSLIVLYIAGWGFPLCYSVIYVIIRAIYANDSCWAKSFGHWEWIIYCPNLFCLVVNLFFLCNILRVLLTQLQSHPNEPSNFRRALKATFVLIPLFGGQLFVTIYRLPAGQPGAAQYEQFTVFVNNSQGFFVALIFCFFNGEVVAQVKRTLTRLNLLPAAMDGTSRGTTMATSLQHRDDDSEYCPTGGANGSLMAHNGQGKGRGSKKAATNGSHAQDGGRNYSYIPMKTLSPST